MTVDEQVAYQLGVEAGEARARAAAAKALDVLERHCREQADQELAAERRACAKLALDQPYAADTKSIVGRRQQWVKEQIAAAILARGAITGTAAHIHGGECDLECVIAGENTSAREND